MQPSPMMPAEDHPMESPQGSLQNHGGMPLIEPADDSSQGRTLRGQALHEKAVFPELCEHVPWQRSAPVGAGNCRFVDLKAFSEMPVAQAVIIIDDPGGTKAASMVLVLADVCQSESHLG